MSFRVGFGFDVHPFSDDPQRRLVLGGVLIDGYRGLRGHSDADVIAHAITDALLGAAGLGDMGTHFPDSDERWSGADSIAMLRHSVQMIHEAGWTAQNVDCTVVAEQPRISPHRVQMQQTMAAVVGAPVSVKASTAEGLGSIGRVEGIACWAATLLMIKEHA